MPMVSLHPESYVRVDVRDDPAATEPPDRWAGYGHFIAACSPDLIAALTRQADEAEALRAEVRRRELTCPEWSDKRTDAELAEHFSHLGYADGDEGYFHRYVSYGEADRIKVALLALAERDRLKAALVLARGALEHSVGIINQWHNMGMHGDNAVRAWAIYREKAPEMQAVNRALAAIRTALGTESQPTLGGLMRDLGGAAGEDDK
jgi:hypothetical protein